MDMPHASSPGSRPGRATGREIAGRLLRVRADHYGDDGTPELAGLLGVPHRTWLNYEAGVAVPAQVVLAVLALTGVEPLWLLRGEGAMYRATASGGP